MTYRSLHKTEERFELAVLAIVLVAFFVAIVLMFIHPSGALLVFALGLLGTGAAAMVVLGMKWLEHRAARHEIREHHCPECGSWINPVDDDPKMWRCSDCEAVFTTAGHRSLA